jgi:D-alanyl-D-alanine carboxypeptidase (penicillin-binding protein 5/6)
MVAVVMAAPDSKTRFAEASQLLDYGFAQYKSVKIAAKGEDAGLVSVQKGVLRQVKAVTQSQLDAVIKRSESDQFQRRVVVTKNITAPVNKGQKLGELRAVRDGKVIAKVNLVAASSVKRAGFFRVLLDTCGSLVRHVFRVSPK